MSIYSEHPIYRLFYNFLCATIKKKKQQQQQQQNKEERKNARPGCIGGIQDQILFCNRALIGSRLPNKFKQKRRLLCDCTVYLSRKVNTVPLHDVVAYTLLFLKEHCFSGAG